MKMIYLLGVCVAYFIATGNSEASTLWNSPVLSSFDTENPANTGCHERLQCSGSGIGDSCPPGLFCESGYCMCGSYPHKIIVCNGTRAFILRRYCATFDAQKNVMSAGNCLRQYNNTKSGMIHSSDNLYHVLPSNVSELNDLMCKPLNRTGKLCGRCLPNHYPLAYAFNMTCIQCPNVRWNWLWYIMRAYLPLTLFCMIILFLKINATSSHLFAVVYYCQTLSTPLLLRILLSILVQQADPSLFTAAELAFALYGIWNLDFFRPFYSHICLGIDVLPVLALDYVVAVYPLLLMTISYLLIVLYDKNYRVVIIMWRPFRFIFSLLRRKWDIRTSIIDVFATFIFLSNVKFLSVSFDLLIPTRVYHFYPTHYNYTLGLLYAGHIQYFGKEHLPYAILALTMLFTFVILPTVLLAVYPCAFFQKFLQMLPVRWHVLHTFVESFYGCYKDGTQPGTRDCRWFASTFFAFRAIQFLLYSLSDATVSLALCVMSISFHYTIITVCQPFKSFEADYNVVNFLFLLFSALFSSTVVTINLCTYMAPQYATTFYILETIFVLVPILYTFGYTLHWLYRHKKFGIDILHRLKCWKNRYNMLEASGSSLPDRIENSGDYPRENLANFVSTDQSGNDT